MATSSPLELMAHPALIPVIVAAPRLWQWKGLHRSLAQREGFLVVEGCEDPRRLLFQCHQISPSILVADREALARCDPEEFAQAADFGRLIRTLVFIPERDEQAMLAYARMGAMGCLVEGTPPATLRKAVHAVARGEMWFERRLLARLVRQLIATAASPKLTPRETDIAKLIGRGCSNRMIAQTLAISHETVRWHIRGIHAKLGIKDRPGAAQYAQRYLDAG